MYVERDDHATGLVRLLTIALRVLTLLEFVVRRRLAESGSLLEAFDEITLTRVANTVPIVRHLTSLSPLQLCILALLDLPPRVYTKLCDDSFEPP